MANPTKKPEPSASASTDRDRKAAELIRQLALVSRQGAQNKLPDVTSDHSFLYSSDTGTPI